MRNHTKSKLRIIGGRWKRRNLEFLKLPEIRPTPIRVRETLFNWIADYIEGANCLDLFSGSGVLSFESISRGAKSATLVEINPRICTQIKSEITRFNNDTIKIITDDVDVFLRQTCTKYDIVFIDPPFNFELAQKTLTTLVQNKHILSPTSLIYIEWGSKTRITPPIELSVLRQKQASKVQYALLSKQYDIKKSTTRL